jgi:type I restriction enzyme S subunit
VNVGIATKTKLKEVCERITVGHVGPMAARYTEDGIPFLRSQNVAPFYLNFDDMKFIPRSFHESLRKSALKPGDVAVVRTGYPGTACVIPYSLSESNCADLVVITPSKKLNPYYLAAIFNSAWDKASVYGNLVGVAQQHFNVSAAKEMEISLPPRVIQDRIAGILSGYSELIENNQRRIKILEEMARLFYREWFVKFRFPGHEKVALVDSPLGPIPKGWRVSEFRDLFNIKYGKTLPIAKVKEEGLYPVYGAGSVIGYYDTVLCPEKCALVTSRGNGSGTVWRTREPAFITNNSLILLPQERFRYWKYPFVELLLKHSNVMEAKTGSAQPQVTIENLNYVKAIAPSRRLVERFCEGVTPIYEQVDLLLKQKENLRRARDLLLPRLIFGHLTLQ